MPRPSILQWGAYIWKNSLYLDLWTKYLKFVVTKYISGSENIRDADQLPIEMYSADEKCVLSENLVVQHTVARVEVERVGEQL